MLFFRRPEEVAKTAEFEEKKVMSNRVKKHFILLHTLNILKDAGGFLWFGLVLLFFFLFSLNIIHSYGSLDIF